MKTEDINATAKELIKALREARQFKFMADMAAAYLANNRYDPEVANWQAQGLIDSGDPSKARDVLTYLMARVPQASPHFIEARGLAGRAWKQIFFDSPDKTSEPAHEAINNAVIAYQACLDLKPDSGDWAGVNLLALSHYAERERIALAIDVDRQALARKILATLDTKPPKDRDNWYHASRAEAYLALDDLDNVELHIGAYVQDKRTTAFNIGSTLRQFTDLWQLDEQVPRGHGIIQALRTALLRDKDDGRLEILPEQISKALVTPPPPHQLEKILGAGGLARYDWLMKGLKIAQSVGVINHASLGRIGTGFLVRGEALFPGLGNELIVVTNAHVISDPPGPYNSVAFGACKITFEAVDKNTSYDFGAVIWQSGVPDLDCTLLRLKTQPVAILPLEIATDMPPIGTAVATNPRVYVIGYPGGRELTFSLQDNELLDHEAPAAGKPPRPAFRRVQYRAPTEPGSSGSPVFDMDQWSVIALHHAGGDAMLRLNGTAGAWPANEGIWIQSIVEAAKTQGVRP